MRKLQQDKKLISQLIKDTYPEIRFQISIGRDADERPRINVGVYQEDDVNILVDLIDTETSCYFVVDTVENGELY